MHIVSVIIPTFNREKFLVSAIESVLKQTYPAIEIVIVDDGSSDNTERVIMDNAGISNIRYIRQENKGPAAARNYGARVSTGDMLAFLDSDDRWDPWKIDTQVRVLDHLEKIPLVFSDYRGCENGQVIESYIREYFPMLKRFKVDYGSIFSNSTAAEGLLNGGPHPSFTVYWGNIFETVFLGNFILTSTVLLRKDAFLSIGGMDEGLRTGEDADFYLRFCKANEVAFMDVTAAEYGLTASNRLTGDNFGALELRTNWYRSLCNVLNAEKAFVETHRAIVQRTLSERCCKIGYSLLAVSRNIRALEFFMKAIRHHPLNISAWGSLGLPILPIGLLAAIFRQVRSWLQLQFNMRP